MTAMTVPFRLLALPALVLAAAALSPATVRAQSCRARAIVENQCTWLVLDERGSDRVSAARAERAATSGLIGGCTAKQYQMVLLRGTAVTDAVAQRLRDRDVVGAGEVRRACAAAARASIP